VAEPIKTEKIVLAAVGEDAPLSCQLLETKVVQQVTWLKVLETTERNICSYSEFFGETVNPGFKEKVQFTEVGLQKSSIVIKSVTEQDGGCYLCLFNIYPDGALIGRTCLMVYATGRPAPTVTLTVLHQNISFSQYTSTSVTNSNGTVTITTTALLSAFSSTEVGCSVSVLSAAPRELLVTVPGLTETSEDDLTAAFDTVDHDVLISCLEQLVGVRSMPLECITEQDVGCYLCLFNIYPDGALIGRTCLKIYATGRPAPSVTLTVLHQNISFSQYNSTSVTNSNGTVTITTTALLSAFSSTEVGCSVSVLSAAPRELLVTVPGLTETSEDGEELFQKYSACRSLLLHRVHGLDNSDIFCTRLKMCSM
ncbi:hypothetical protein GOODEAATRI_028926, partial [Goodea atripinnis]